MFILVLERPELPFEISGGGGGKRTDLSTSLGNDRLELFSPPRTSSQARQRVTVHEW
jgi:hypothetical protein